MFKIAIMGCGVVGSGVADILIEKSAELSQRFQETVSLSKILDVRDMPGSPYEPYLTKDAEEIFGDEEIKLVVMTIGGLDFAYQLSKRALLSGRHVVTSNKEVVAAYGRELTQIAFDNGVRFLYEASAGGGIPIIRPLNMCLAGNDIFEIQGILNGTTNYILTKMHRDRMSFEEALAKAQKKGYAEANPSADVDGHDAARKIAILSSVAYRRFVDYETIPCTGIRKISYEDHVFADRIGYVIKLIGRSTQTENGIQASVEPLLLPKDHMLAGVQSVFNAVLTKGNFVGDSLFYGKGAGKLPTASAVVGDIIDILGRPQEASLPDFVQQDAIMDQSEHSNRFYLRFRKHNVEMAHSEYLRIATSIFGSASVDCGTAETDDTVAALVTGFLTLSELERKLGELTTALPLTVENQMKMME